MDKSIDGLATPLTQLKEEVLVCSFSEYVIHTFYVSADYQPAHVCMHKHMYCVGHVCACIILS